MVTHDLPKNILRMKFAYIRYDKAKWVMRHAASVEQIRLKLIRWKKEVNNER